MLVPSSRRTTTLASLSVFTMPTVPFTQRRSAIIANEHHLRAAFEREIFGAGNLSCVAFSNVPSQRLRKPRFSRQRRQARLVFLGGRLARWNEDEVLSRQRAARARRSTPPPPRQHLRRRGCGEHRRERSVALPVDDLQLDGKELQSFRLRAEKKCGDE